MTGFGESHFTIDSVSFSIRLKSINSRFLEINFHFPDEFGWLEEKAEQHLKKKISRGKIEVFFSFDRLLPRKAQINQEILASYLQTFRQQYNRKNLEISPETMVSLPGVLELQTTSFVEYQHKFEYHFIKALIKTMRARQSEGKKLKQWMRKSTRLMSRLNRKISIHNSRRENLLQKIFSDKISSLLAETASRDKHQLQQQLWHEFKGDILGYLHSDITEETERLKIHLADLQELFETSGEKGKKIEFILQEILREVNTLSAKTRVTEINRIGIAMKVEVEKLREQARNIV